MKRPAQLVRAWAEIKWGVRGGPTAERIRVGSRHSRSRYAVDAKCQVIHQRQTGNHPVEPQGARASNGSLDRGRLTIGDSSAAGNRDKIVVVGPTIDPEPWRVSGRHPEQIGVQRVVEVEIIQKGNRACPGSKL